MSFGRPFPLVSVPLDVFVWAPVILFLDLCYCLQLLWPLHAADAVFLSKTKTDYAPLTAGNWSLKATQPGFPESPSNFEDTDKLRAFSYSALILIKDFECGRKNFSPNGHQII